MRKSVAKSSILILAVFNFIILAGQEKAKDADGNTYKTVIVSKHIWIASNLNVSHYNNGDSIPQVQDPVIWANLKSGAWCYYDFKNGDHITRGKLYNGYAVLDKRGLVPKGWSVPTDKEWLEFEDWHTDNSKGYATDDTTKLRQFLGDDISTMNCQKNKCYFRWGSGKFDTMNGLGLWWLPGNEDLTWQLSRCEGRDGMWFGLAGMPSDWKNYGFFVRCIKTK